jgi:histone H3/H4
MSLQKSIIYTIANTIGISNDEISDEIAQSLASDAEYRIREIIQDAAKFMKHSKRNVLKCEDVNHALSMKNVQVCDLIRHFLLEITKYSNNHCSLCMDTSHPIIPMLHNSILWKEHRIYTFWKTKKLN